MKTIALASAGLAAAVLFFAGAAAAQPSMRDSSTIVTVSGGWLVQYGARGQQINNATLCSEDDMQRADLITGRGREFGGGFGGNSDFGGGGVSSGSWARSCRGGRMRGEIFQAECRDNQGRWNATILDMRNCNTGQRKTAMARWSASESALR